MSRQRSARPRGRTAGWLVRSGPASNLANSRQSYGRLTRRRWLRRGSVRFSGTNSSTMAGGVRGSTRLGGRTRRGSEVRIRFLDHAGVAVRWRGTSPEGSRVVNPGDCRVSGVFVPPRGLAVPRLRLVSAVGRRAVAGRGGPSRLRVEEDLPDCSTHRRRAVRNYRVPINPVEMLRVSTAAAPQPVRRVPRPLRPCWRRLAEWTEVGVWPRLHEVEVLLAKLRRADALDFSRAAVDGSHIRA